MGAESELEGPHIMGENLLRHQEQGLEQPSCRLN